MKGSLHDKRAFTRWEECPVKYPFFGQDATLSAPRGRLIDRVGDDRPSGEVWLDLWDGSSKGLEF